MRDDMRDDVSSMAANWKGWLTVLAGLALCLTSSVLLLNIGASLVIAAFACIVIGALLIAIRGVLHHIRR